MEREPNKMGFTLIELMITVAILGVLAAVAVTAYGIYVRKSHNAEATAVLADIRIKQEAYRATFRQYADLSSHGWQPTDSPGPSAVAWPSPSPTAWRQLGSSPSGLVRFIFTGHSGAPGTVPADIYLDNDLSTSTNWYTNDFWYGAQALQDLNGDQKCEGFVIVSGQTSMVEIEMACPS